MSGLNVGDEIRLLMLQRVHDGRISERFTFYFDDGEPIWHWAKYAISGLFVARCVEAIYPPDSPARRLEFVPLGLTLCAELGLTEADVTRRVVLTERGQAALAELSEQQTNSAVVGR